MLLLKDYLYNRTDSSYHHVKASTHELLLRHLCFLKHNLHSLDPTSKQTDKQTNNNSYDTHETHAHTLDANRAQQLNHSVLDSEVCSSILPTSTETQRQVMFLLGCHESETQPFSSCPYKPQKKKSRQPQRVCSWVLSELDCITALKDEQRR